jgi:mannose-6-phosphate isomerase-like protein (cupin superfamily)
MFVKRYNEAKPYEAAGHTGCYAMRLFGAEAGGAKDVVVGISHFLPGGGVAMSGSPPEKVYFVLEGELTIVTREGETVLKKNDSICFAPNEERAIENRSNSVASILVMIMPPKK